MILVSPSETSQNALHQACVFADQLAAAGFDPVLDPEVVPDDANLATKLHALPYLRHLDQVELTHLAIIGVEIYEPDTLDRLRKIRLTETTQVFGFGRFDTPQDEISATSRIVYATGRQPVMTDLAETPLVSAGKSICPCFGTNIQMTSIPYLRGRPSITLIAPDMEQPETPRSLQALTTTQAFNSLIYMSGKNKSEWIRQFGPGAHVYGFTEVSPARLSTMSDILIMTGPIGNNYNALCLLNNHTVSGGAIIDASPNGQFVAAGYPGHRGPVDLGYMSHFLRETILPNLDGIKEATQKSRLSPSLSLMNAFGDVPPSKKKAVKNRQKSRSVYFMPTNGNGLGHAQRCVLIAEELEKQKTKSSFFAFPSCVPMINKAGFGATPLVPRTDLHLDTGANDLANYPRLSSQMTDSDTFVFDGGYVFDSIYRTIVDRNLKSVWIRRGLWPSEQDNRIPLDREKYFSHVIEPSEAFDTLNHNISSGSHIRQIGPIVRQIKSTQKDKKALHSALKKQFGLTFEKLVVTMLGSGLLHNLSANVQTVCNALERRDDCLNLIIVWPSAVVPSERYSWQRSKVVKTIQASWLAANADFVVSAAGYNSFHEAMYNRVPTIFVPQNAQVLDDQAARAEAAEKEGLAAHVPAIKLSQLDREVRRFLDEDKATEIRQALEKHQFPDPGNKRAAELIQEVMA